VSDNNRLFHVIGVVLSGIHTNYYLIALFQTVLYSDQKALVSVRIEVSIVCLYTGSTVYTCMLNKHGGVEADLTVSAIEPGSGVHPHDPAFQGSLRLVSDTTPHRTLSVCTVRQCNGRD